MNQRRLAFELRAQIDIAIRTGRVSDVDRVRSLIEGNRTNARSGHVRERLGQARREWLEEHGLEEVE